MNKKSYPVVTDYEIERITAEAHRLRREMFAAGLRRAAQAVRNLVVAATAKPAHR